MAGPVFYNACTQWQTVLSNKSHLVAISGLSGAVPVVMTPDCNKVIITHNPFVSWPACVYTFIDTVTPNVPTRTYIDIIVPVCDNIVPWPVCEMVST